MSEIYDPTNPNQISPYIITTSPNTTGTGINYGTGYTYTYPTTGTGTGIDWGVGNGMYTIQSDPNLNGARLHVQGDADIDGDLKIKGKSINNSLERIEERLAILRPNEELEKKWDNLRELRKQYMELEQEIIEKEKMWDILKK